MIHFLVDLFERYYINQYNVKNIEHQIYTPIHADCVTAEAMGHQISDLSRKPYGP